MRAERASTIKINSVDLYHEALNTSVDSEYSMIFL